MKREFGDRFILPFCERKKVNNKGGTASVFQIAVQKEFVSDEIKKHLGKPFKVRKYGEVSEIDFIRFNFTRSIGDVI